MRLLILGGGGFRVPLIVRALAARPDTGVDDVVLYDIDPGRLTVIGDAVGGALRQAGLAGPRLSTSTDLDRSLSGADVVFSAIRVGGAAGRVRDERRAIGLGLLGQETVGAGGLAYGLRTLPVVLDLARRQAELAPGATLINFTNPAGLVTQALTAILGRRVIGICDSPIALIRRARQALNAPDAVFDYAGINHLGWLRRLEVDGVDLLPRLLSDAAALQTFEEGRLFGVELLRALGSLPNEYLHFYYHLAAAVTAQAAGATRGEVVGRDQDSFYARAQDGGDRFAAWERTRRRREDTYFAEARPTGQRRDEADTSGAGYEEVAVNLLAALAGGPQHDLIVNAPNAGAIPGLPDTMVIETRCRVDPSGATPVPTEPLEQHQLGLVTSVRAAESDIIAAVVDGSRDRAVRGFALHPLIRSWDSAEQLVASILDDHPALADLLR